MRCLANSSSITDILRKRGSILIGILLLPVLFLTTGCQTQLTSKAPYVPTYDIDKIIDELPDGDVWLNHLEEDLLPFWTIKNAFGKPLGNFPTYKNNDGTLPDPSHLSEEYKKALADKGLEGLIKLNREYARAQSRQTYAYGIAYHMTGKEQYLKYAKAGVDFLRNTFIDRNNGGAYTYFDKEENTLKPLSPQRTSQDMAYALTGIGFYYYLTHDKKVLKDILSIKKHIFRTYYDKELGLLRWVLAESPDGDKPNQKELVSQLDQVYAYMLWLAPSLPEPYRTEWKKDLKDLAYVMMSQFFSEKYQFFWGTITDSSVKKIGTPHTDFGHSIKTLWLIYQIGKMTEDLALINFAKDKAVKIIDVAYLEETGSWGRRFDQNGNLDKDKEWWGLAELDQTTATLSLIDPSYARYLTGTYDYWLKYMVDRRVRADGSRIGGIWHMVDGETNRPVLKYPKQHSWKSCLHTFEHALICYLTTQQLKGENIKLYFAFDKKAGKGVMHPYFFLGKVDAVKKSRFSTLTELEKYEVTISDLR